MEPELISTLVPLKMGSYTKNRLKNWEADATRETGGGGSCDLSQRRRKRDEQRNMITGVE